MNIFEEVVIFVFSYGYIIAAIPFGLGLRMDISERIDLDKALDSVMDD